MVDRPIKAHKIKPIKMPIRTRLIKKPITRPKIMARPYAISFLDNPFFVSVAI
jgi:hypothetical protein